jgi:hypothetical protein
VTFFVRTPGGYLPAPHDLKDVAGTRRYPTRTADELLSMYARDPEDPTADEILAGIFFARKHDPDSI